LVASHRASTGKAATFDSSIGFFEGSVDGRLSDVLVKNVSAEHFEDKKGGGRHDRNGPGWRREPSIVNEPWANQQQKRH
jgi:hypothetical protein